MTTPTGGELLRALGSGVRPGWGEAQGRRGDALGALDFNAMLESARAGELGSGRPVEIEPGLELDLDSQTLAGIARAVDRAQAEGASKVLVLVDGVGYEVDVLTRRITRQVDVLAGEVATGVDAVVSIDADEQEGPTLLPPAGAITASLERALRRTG